MKLGTINVQGSSLESLEIVLRSLGKLHLDLTVLTETNLGFYFPRKSQGYQVYEQDLHENGPRNRGGSVALAIRIPPKDVRIPWYIEDVSFFGRNIIKCTLVSVMKRWDIIGMYLTPVTDPTENLNMFQSESRSSRNPTVVLGDFNCDLEANPQET